MLFPLTYLYNCNKYYTQIPNKSLKKRVEDEWIISRLNTTIKEVTENLEKYFLNDAFKVLMNFVVNDFSRGYIKITRDREDNKEILGEVLKKISKILAPFTPYISEYIYQNFSKKSVHLSDWPKVEKKHIDLDIQFHGLNLLIEKGLAERDKEKIGLKWPLSKATITYYIKLNKDVEEILKTQLNVKEISWKKQTGQHNWKIELDTNITPKLEVEGYAREMSRQIQAFRKKLGFVKTDKVNLIIITNKKFKEMLEKQKEFLKNRTNSKTLEVKDENTIKKGETFKNNIEFKIKDKGGKIVIK